MSDPYVTGTFGDIAPELRHVGPKPRPCESCGAAPDPARLAEGKVVIRHRATEPTPSLDALEDAVYDGESTATDGCTVDPDGRCEHGHPSWLLVLGLI
jgi:hypothetical protein